MSFNPLKYYLQIANIIKTNNKDIDTSIGTVVGDTVVLPMCVLYEKVSKINDLLLKITNLEGIVTALEDPEFISDSAIAMDLTEAEVINILNTILNNIAKDYSITRLPEKSATGIVYFQFERPISAKTYIISPTIRIKSVFNLWYAPIQTYVFTIDPQSSEPALLPDRYYVSTLGGYAFPIEVVCETPGPIGNISGGQIAFDQFGTPTDFIFATNLDKISGGRNLETNSELVSRIKLKWKGQNLGTKGGFLNLLKEQGYTDVYISGPADQYMLREAYGGAIDIYIRNYTEIIYTTSLTLEAGKEYLVKNLINMSDKLPIHRVFLLSGPANSTVTLIKDLSTLYRFSGRANDKIVVDQTGDYSLSFTYNKDVSFLQSLLTSDEYCVLGQDILVREALPVNIEIECSVSLRSGASPEMVKQDIINTIVKFVNELPLGAQLAQSDLIGVIEQVKGVDFVITPLIKFKKENMNNEDILILEKIEYFQISNLKINI